MWRNPYDASIAFTHAGIASYRQFALGNLLDKFELNDNGISSIRIFWYIGVELERALIYSSMDSSLLQVLPPYQIISSNLIFMHESRSDLHSAPLSIVSKLQGTKKTVSWITTTTRQNFCKHLDRVCNHIYHFRFMCLFSMWRTSIWILKRTFG